MKIISTILMLVGTVMLTVHMVAAESLSSMLKSWVIEVNQKMTECKFSSPLEAQDYFDTTLRSVMQRAIITPDDFINVHRYMDPALLETKDQMEGCLVRLHR